MSVTTNLGRVGLVPKGEYSDESSYKRLDFVVYEGSSYVALKDTQGVPPTPENVAPAVGAVWQLQASMGGPGADGQPGKDGAPGKDGKDYVILGPVYETLDALRQAVTSPNEGDRYEAGTQPPYDVYRWTGADWVNEGTSTGGGGGATANFTINGHALNDENPEVNLNAEDVHARPDTWTPTAQDVGARPDSWTPTAQEVGARPDTWTPNAKEVGALPSDTIIPSILEGDQSRKKVSFSLEGSVLTITVA